MKYFLITIGLVSVLAGIARADVYKFRQNPTTGRPDLVTEIAPNITPGSSYSGFTFNGTDFCLYVNGVQKECWSQAAGTVAYAILENNTYFLLEDSARMRLENGGL